MATSDSVHGSLARLLIYRSKHPERDRACCHNCVNFLVIRRRATERHLARTDDAMQIMMRMMPSGSELVAMTNSSVGIVWEEGLRCIKRSSRSQWHTRD